MVREAPAQPAPPPKPYPAERARGGEIILKTPPRRWAFFASAVVLVLLFSILR